MTLRKKIALMLLILTPLVTGLVVLVRFEKRRQPATTVNSAPKATPANTAHEMASLEVELKKNPTHPPILLRMAELKRDKGDLQEALQLLRKAAEADDSNIEAKLELGKALFEAGDSDGAIAATKSILDKDPQHVDALYNLGAIYGNIGAAPTAREYFQRAAAAGPTTESGRNAAAALNVLNQAGTNPHAAAVH